MFSVPALEHDVTLVEQYFTASGSVPVVERIVTSQVLEELGSRKIKDLFLKTQCLFLCWNSVHLGNNSFLQENGTGTIR